MTEQPHDPQQMRPPLRRSKDDRVIAGVCGGLARTLGIDPIIVRVLVAAFTLVGGAGLFAYIIAWIVIPDDDGATVVDSHREGSKLGKLVLAIVLAALGLAVVSSLSPWNGNDAFGFFLFVLIALVLWQAFGQDWLAGSKGERPSEWLGDWKGSSMKVEKTATEQHVTFESPTGEQWTVSKQRAVLGRIVWNVLIIIAGAALALRWSGADIRYGGVLAVMLAVVGLALVLSAFAGRARGLIAVGLVLGALALPVGWHADGDMGTRVWAPTAISALAAGHYSLGVGDAQLDLRGVAPADSATVTTAASVGVGKLLVLLPQDAKVRYLVTAHVSLGDIALPDAAKRSGSGLSATAELGAAAGPSVPTMHLDLDVSMGELEVRYA